MKPFLPSLGVLPQIDFAIQQGRGAAGSVLGQTFDVYRLSDTTNVAIVSGSPLIVNFPSIMRRNTSKKDLENQTFELMTYEAVCNNQPLAKGDVLVQNGYDNDDSVFTFAGFRAPGKTMMVRTEFNATITRPRPTAGDTSQQPGSMNTYVGTDVGWSGTALEDEEILTLVDGLYAFSYEEGATPAQVYVGLVPNSRVKDGNTLGVPTEQYRDQFLCYVPMLPGETLNELDRINFGLSDRYEIMKFHTSDETGLGGYVMMVEKLGL